MIIVDSPNINNTNTYTNQPNIDTNAFYNALWRASELSLYVVDVLDSGADFRFVDFNQGYVEHTYLPVENLKGRTLTEAFSVEKANNYRQHFNRCVLTKESASFEESLLTEGETTYWRITVCPLVSATGSIKQLLVTVTDITEHKQNAELVETGKILQQVIDKVPAMILWKDRDSNLLGCNQHFLKISGFAEIADIPGKTDYDMPWKTEEADFFIKCDQRIMGSDRPELNIIEPQLQAGGRQAWLSTDKVPLHNEQGQVIGIFVMIEDITAQKDTKDKQDRLLDILSATPDVVTITDIEGKCRYLNKAGQRIFGIADNQVSNLDISMFSHPQTAKTLHEEAFLTAQNEGIWAGESIIQDCHKNEIPVSHVVVCHQLQEGGSQYFSSIMRDISDRKAAEAILTQQSEELSQALIELQKTQAQIIQSEKMSSLGRMVAGVAHEINNPVNFIHGNLQPASIYAQELLALIDLYNHSYPNPTEEIETAIEDLDIDFVRQDLPKLLNSMSAGTERIREIVLSLRNFSRLDESDVKTVDIHEGIDSTLVILNHRLKSDNEKKSISVTKQYGDLPMVDCFPSQLNQVLMNILANAIEALEKESNPEIAIATEVNRDFINIRIKDNGPGIPQEVQSKILDPFFTTKPIGKGTGMGMSISYQIITEKHGGQLKFASQTGKGTEFCITIPIHQPITEET